MNPNIKKIIIILKIMVPPVWNRWRRWWRWKWKQGYKFYSVKGKKNADQLRKINCGGRKGICFLKHNIFIFADVYSDHLVRVAWICDNGWKHSTLGIFSCKSYLDHCRFVINNYWLRYMPISILMFNLNIN